MHLSDPLWRPSPSRSARRKERGTSRWVVIARERCARGTARSGNRAGERACVVARRTTKSLHRYPDGKAQWWRERLTSAIRAFTYPHLGCYPMGHEQYLGIGVSRAIRRSHRLVSPLLSDGISAGRAGIPPQETTDRCTPEQDAALVFLGLFGQLR